jgi:hypothetical protein
MWGEKQDNAIMLIGSLARPNCRLHGEMCGVCCVLFAVTDEDRGPKALFLTGRAATVRGRWGGELSES